MEINPVYFELAYFCPEKIASQSMFYNIGYSGSYRPFIPLQKITVDHNQIK